MKIFNGNFFRLQLSKAIPLRETVVLFTLLVLFTSCQQNDELAGTWDDYKGQIIEFKSNGEALWIFYSSSSYDTIKAKYTIDYSTQPAKLTLSDFSETELFGQTLYGIVEIDKTQDAMLYDWAFSEQLRPNRIYNYRAQTFFRE